MDDFELSVDAESGRFIALAGRMRQHNAAMYDLTDIEGLVDETEEAVPANVSNFGNA